MSGPICCISITGVRTCFYCGDLSLAAHTNYFVEESVLGPLIISVEDETDQQEYRVLVRSEKVEHLLNGTKNDEKQGTQRVNIRTGKRRREKLQKILGLDVQLKVAREPKLRDELLSLEQQQVRFEKCVQLLILFTLGKCSEMLQNFMKWTME